MKGHAVLSASLALGLVFFFVLPGPAQDASHLFACEWTNTDANALEIARVRIAKSAEGGWTIEAWGKTPKGKEISGGATRLRLFGADPRAPDADRLFGLATWDLGIRKRTAALRLKDGKLEVESYVVTSSDTGRGDYRRLDTFSKSE